MSRGSIVEGDLTWTGAGFETGVQVRLGADGNIEEVGRGLGTTCHRLTGCAVLPGMINAHSHAFQRALRGRGERFPEGVGTFWSWRDAMYGLVERLDEATVQEVSRQAFSEMRAAGITSVGEFHYVHHDASAEGYALDEAVLRAATEAGIRIVLLTAYYRSGGFNQPLRGAQQRFRTGSPEEYWDQVDRLGANLDPATQSLGAVVHSARAASLDEIVGISNEASRRGLVFHMHVEEQPREIEDCLDHYGRTPLALLNEHVTVSPRFTAVHCTHSAAADMDDYLAAGGNVCICPLTEANLGDGIANVPHMLRNGGRICLGTDSNARISMQEEMRWLEYVQRLAAQSRGICIDDAGAVAPVLWSMATASGARSLGLRAGVIEPGSHGDLIAVDLAAPALSGVDADTLLEAFILGADRDVIAATCVGGHWMAHSARGQALLPG